MHKGRATCGVDVARSTSTSLKCTPHRDRERHRYPMSDQDRIGSHGEFLFQSLISRMCYERFFFHPIPVGEKHPTTDMIVELGTVLQIGFRHREPQKNPRKMAVTPG